MVQPLGLYQTEGLRPSFNSQQPMTNEVLDRAAGFATCQILANAGGALVGAGAWSLAAGGAGVVPLTLGSLSLLGAGFACQDTPVDGAPPKSDQIDGCGNIEAGGYGQFQIKLPGGDWTDQTDKPVYTNAISINPFPPFQTSAGGTWAVNCEVYSATDGTTDTVGGFATESDAAAVKFRINPTNGICADLPGDLPSPPADAFEPIPYTDEQTGCTYNVQLLGFVEQYAGGTQDPVYVISGSDVLRADGGRVGGCNFSPTVYYGGSGGGGDFGGGDGAPPFPYIPGDGDDGLPNWLVTLGNALAGAGGALIADAIADAIQAALATEYPGLVYRMVSVCEKDASGEPISEQVEVPIPDLKAPDAQLARLDAIVELLQASKNFKQPICGDETPEPEGDFRTISFRSAETSPYGKSRLRKRLRYRSLQSVGLESLVNYWKDFQWEAGPIRVRHIGSSWGAPEVWAATEDEGKRVLRYAAGEAGIDPDKVGRWTARRSNSSRRGVLGTMNVDTTGGYFWITERDGSSQRPVVALISE